MILCHVRRWEPLDSQLRCPSLRHLPPLSVNLFLFSFWIRKKWKNMIYIMWVIRGGKKNLNQHFVEYGQNIFWWRKVFLITQRNFWVWKLSWHYYEIQFKQRIYSPIAIWRIFDCGPGKKLPIIKRGNWIFHGKRPPSEEGSMERSLFLVNRRKVNFGYLFIMMKCQTNAPC